MSKDKIVIWQQESQRSRATSYRRGAETYIKCLTELITNSHLAYAKMREAGSQVQGKPIIKIIANQRGEYFEVYDYATGLAKNENELNKRLGWYSDVQEDVHTIKTRSMFGRGLSDVLFRQPAKEATILSHKEGVCLKITCRWDKKNGGRDLQPLLEAIIAPDEVKEKLPVQGTYVKFYWSSRKEETGFPSKVELVTGLRRYYELKNILLDPSIDVILEYHDWNGKETKERLEFYTCVKSPVGKELGGLALPVRGYDVRVISAKMYRAAERLNQQKRAEARTGGLYVEGEHGQVYDLTLFGLEDSNPDVTQYLVGEIILSEDSKRYFQEEYTKRNEEVITRTREGIREGHNFYKLLRGAVIDWIKEIIASERKGPPVSSDLDAGKEAYDELNRIADEFLGKSVVVVDPPIGPGQPKREVDTIEFASSEYSIIQDKISRITLLVNTEKFAQGTKIHFVSPNPDFKVNPKQDKVPEAAPGEKVAHVAVEVTCSVLDSVGSIIATCDALDGSMASDRAELKCVDDITEPPFHEYLEFKPKKVIAEPDHLAKVHLWMHSNVIEPGAVIALEFNPSEESGQGETIIFYGDNTPSDSAKKAFEFIVDDSLPAKNGYREYQVKFTGKKDGLKGTLTARVQSGAMGIPPARCEIEIKSKVKPGMLTGWLAEDSEVNQYAFFREYDGKVVFNLNYPLVRKVLGDSYEVAKKRRDRYQEAAMFVAQGIMDIFLEHILRKAAHENPASIFTQDYLNKEDQRWDEALEQILLKKHEIIKSSGKTIVTKFVQGFRENVPLGDINDLALSYNGKVKVVLKWWKESQAKKEVSSDDAVISIGGVKNVIATADMFGFKYDGLEFYVQVCKLHNGQFAVRIYDVIGLGERERYLRQVLGEVQVFRAPSNMPTGIVGDWLFSPVALGGLTRNGEPTLNRHLTPEKFHQIPDSPKKNIDEQICEDKLGWLENGRPLIHYDVYDNVVTANRDASLKGMLVSLIQSERADIMALNFVRTKVVPLVAALERSR
jgi:hypothetical protein